VKIHALIPSSLERNLGAAYNEEMARLPDGDWALMVDHDAILGLTRDWHQMVDEAIRFMPDAGAFVAVTNRIDAVWQRAEEADPDNHDVLYHTQLALARRDRRTLLDITGTKGFGGVTFALSKAAWRAAGGFADGLLCVDHSIFFRLRAAGYRIWLMENLYVYHRRRAAIGPLPEDTPRVPDCPCRGHEQMPSQRLRLPEIRP
jgi:GT2 family glycosyltransferase